MNNCFTDCDLYNIIKAYSLAKSLSKMFLAIDPETIKLPRLIPLNNDNLSLEEKIFINNAHMSSIDKYFKDDMVSEDIEAYYITPNFRFFIMPDDFNNKHYDFVLFGNQAKLLSLFFSKSIFDEQYEADRMVLDALKIYMNYFLVESKICNIPYDYNICDLYSDIIENDISDFSTIIETITFVTNYYVILFDLFNKVVPTTCSEINNIISESPMYNALFKCTDICALYNYACKENKQSLYKSIIDDTYSILYTYTKKG